MKTAQQWHIFCTVVDNFGDIGTTWRLAQQLHSEHQRDVTLFVDDLAALGVLVPESDIYTSQQTLHGITVIHWTDDFLEIKPAPIVIEAFACTLPNSYRGAMVQNGSICINLDYFSCEDWVAGCHQLPSYQSDGLKKWFFFPGIASQTGGLLREQSLFADRDHFCKHPSLRQQWCQDWKTPLPQTNSIKLSLFGYENTVLPELLASLSQHATPVDVYLPEGKLRQSASGLFADASLTTGNTLTLGQLRLHLIPFLPQAEFDKLLWLCDLNFVRGEESLARAIWAGKPFVWHIYPTEDGAHWHKLNAFITTYNMPDSLAQLNRDWNQQQLDIKNLQSCLFGLPLLSRFCHQKAKDLSQQQDLCQQLIDFVQSR